MTLNELVEEYLRVHQAAPSTLEKLRWLLSKATAVFGAVALGELRADTICAWRGTLPEGHRFEATQALRQVFAAGRRHRVDGRVRRGDRPASRRVGRARATGR
jgi:hypothetical protein